MRLPEPRGSYSESLIRCLRDEGTAPAALCSADRVLDDNDVQISLWMLYELHYHGFEEVRPDAEWDPAVLQSRRGLEEVFEPATPASCQVQLRSERLSRSSYGRFSPAAVDCCCVGTARGD